MRNLLISILAIIFLTSCNSHEKSKFFNVGQDGWHHDNILSYTPTTTLADSDSVDFHNVGIAVAIRHTNNYEYSNIWIELKYTKTDTVETDTFNMRMADDYGKWFGSGVGVSYQYVDTLVRNTEIDLAKPILLRHIMRVDTLPDIEQAGIIIFQ